MKVKSYYPVTLTIDGEEVKIRIKRMDLEESGDFSRALEKVGTPAHLRFVSRDANGPEQERKSDGFFVIPFDEIKDRKLLELTAERRVEYEVAEEEHEQSSRKFLLWMFETFVTVESGLTEEDAGGTERTVTDGLDFLRVFGGRLDVLQEVMTAVRLENSLDAAEKKALKSRTASPPFSAALEPAPLGPKPEPTVENAAIADSAKIAHATKRPPTQSGSTPTPSSSSLQTVVPS